MRLIDAESLAIAMAKRESTNCSPMYHRGYEDMLAAVGEAKTIDAKPVVHGEWVNVVGGFFEMGRCSVCGGQWPTAGGLNFCPNCGADMRGDKHD